MKIRFRHILFVLIILLRGIPSTCQEISDSLRIHFQQSKSLFNESVAGNSQFYGSLADLLEMAKRKDVEIVSITVYGAASPEGGIGYNKGLSKRRADRIASYIAEVGGGRISPEVIAVGRDWKEACTILPWLIVNCHRAKRHWICFVVLLCQMTKSLKTGCSPS